MRHIRDELDKRRVQARAGGGERRIASQHAKGKLTARERIDLLLAHFGGAGAEATVSGQEISWNLDVVGHRTLR